MIVLEICLAFLAKIKITANWTFISYSNYSLLVASITCDILMNNRLISFLILLLVSQWIFFLLFYLFLNESVLFSFHFRTYLTFDFGNNFWHNLLDFLLDDWLLKKRNLDWSFLLWLFVWILPDDWNFILNNFLLCFINLYLIDMLYRFLIKGSKIYLNSFKSWGK